MQSPHTLYSRNIPPARKPQTTRLKPAVIVVGYENIFLPPSYVVLCVASQNAWLHYRWLPFVVDVYVGSDRARYIYKRRALAKVKCWFPFGATDCQYNMNEVVFIVLSITFLQFSYNVLGRNRMEDFEC